MPRDRKKNHQSEATPAKTRSATKAAAGKEEENKQMAAEKTQAPPETKRKGLRMREVNAPGPANAPGTKKNEAAPATRTEGLPMAGNVDGPGPSNAPGTKKNEAAPATRAEGLPMAGNVDRPGPSNAPESTQDGTKIQDGSKKKKILLNIPQIGASRSDNIEGPKSPSNEGFLSMEEELCWICSHTMKDGMVIFDCQAICCRNCIKKHDGATICPRCDNDGELCEPIARGVLSKLLKNYKKRILKVPRRKFLQWIIPFNKDTKIMEFDRSLADEAIRQETRELIDSKFDRDHGLLEALRRVFSQFFTGQLSGKYGLTRRLEHKFCDYELYSIMSECVKEKFQGDPELMEYDKIASDAFRDVRRYGHNAGSSKSGK